MKFDELHAFLPYVTEGNLHNEIYYVYPDVRCRFPGKHALDTVPPGGDFVVEVNCENAGWSWKQFTHIDLFKDIEEKTLYNPHVMKGFLAPELCQVVLGTLGVSSSTTWKSVLLPGIKSASLLQASQALAVAEHRRYHQHEANGGGRYLPLRFSLGIIFGHWTAQDAAKVQRQGIRGLRELTKEFGSPPTVKQLAKELI